MGLIRIVRFLCDDRRDDRGTVHEGLTQAGKRPASHAPHTAGFDGQTVMDLTTRNIVAQLN